MKKKIAIIIAVCVLAAFVLLFPIRLSLSDGGTTGYRALLYSVWDVHRLAPIESEKEFEEGTIIEILGIEVFNNVK